MTMTRKNTEMCDRAAEPILSGEWQGLGASDPIRLHIGSCRECQSRIEEVCFFAEVFSSDSPKVGLRMRPPVATLPALPTARKESSAPWLKPLLKVGSFAAAACFVAVLMWSLFQPESVGRIAALEGEATIRRFGSRSEDSASEGTRVYQGDQIRTGSSSRLHLRLEESNDIHMNESTEIRIEATRLLHQDTGEAWYEIAKGQGEFEIESRGADVLVLGTSFGVRYENDEVLVPVSSGRVRVLTKGGEIELDPGHVGVYSSSKPYLPPVRQKDLYPDSRPLWLLTSTTDVN